MFGGVYLIPVSIQRLKPNHFVRASLDVPTDVCIAQLKRMQWAASISAIENHQADAAPCYLEQLKPYMPVGPGGRIPICPAGGTYSVSIFTNLPFCNRPGHVLPAAP